jgi:hypothetical protein
MRIPAFSEVVRICKEYMLFGRVGGKKEVGLLYKRLVEIYTFF